MSEGKILIVEDEPSLREVIALYLRRANFEVVSVADGQAALEALQAGPVSLVVLDLMIPKVDGYQVTEWLRRRGDTPIIMVTARRAESDRIAGLEMGADDYVIKPFRMRELAARVRAALRRAEPEAAGAKPWRVGDLVMDEATHTVTVRGQGVNLTPTEFNLLAVFMRSPGQVFTRQQLADRLAEDGYAGLERTLNVHIRNVRIKIETDPENPLYIETVYGVGYRLCKPDADA